MCMIVAWLLYVLHAIHTHIERDETTVAAVGPSKRSSSSSQNRVIAEMAHRTRGTYSTSYTHVRRSATATNSHHVRMCMYTSVTVGRSVGRFGLHHIAPIP